MKIFQIATFSVLFSTTFLYGSWQDSIGSLLQNSNITQNKQGTTTASSLSTTDMNGALKQALNVGVEYAVQSLGAQNGCLNNSLVKIGLPKSLQTTADLVRKVGGDKYVDDLIVALNNSATQAAPKTAQIFANSISNMSIDDAKQILNGADDAATQYFRKSTTKQLQETILPIVEKSMSENSVAQYYAAFQKFYKNNAGVLKNDQVSGIANSLGFGSVLPTKEDEDLNSYVTNKAIDGLMIMIAQKEQAIRANPMMQSSSLIQKVFSAF